MSKRGEATSDGTKKVGLRVGSLSGRIREGAAKKKGLTTNDLVGEAMPAPHDAARLLLRLGSTEGCRQRDGRWKKAKEEQKKVVNRRERPGGLG